MKRVALVGGIGAGKSAASERLASLGYRVIDADVVARDVVEVGAPAYDALVDAFGTAVLSSDATLDRAFLADVVFSDPTALRRLNHVTHGYIGVAIAAAFDELDPDSDVAFVALPLFRPEHRDAFRLDRVWVLRARPEVAVARLTHQRGLSEADARARLATQTSVEELIEQADRVIENEGSLEDLYAQLDVALDELGVGRD